MPYLEIVYDDIIFDKNVYKFCRNSKFTCPNYGHSWSCPPASPYLKDELSKYNRFFLIYYKFDIKAGSNKGSEKMHYPIEEKISSSLTQENHLYLEINGEINRFIKKHVNHSDEYLVLWPENCRICFYEGKECTYGEKIPCRYPKKIRYSMTGAGINTHETIKKFDFILEWPPMNYEYRLGLVSIQYQ